MNPVFYLKLKVNTVGTWYDLNCPDLTTDNLKWPLMSINIFLIAISQIILDIFGEIDDWNLWVIKLTSSLFFRFLSVGYLLTYCKYKCPTESLIYIWVISMTSSVWRHLVIYINDLVVFIVRLPGGRSISARDIIVGIHQMAWSLWGYCRF